MGRPSIHKPGPVVNARDLDSDHVGSWCNGVWTPKDSPLVKNAIAAAERGQEYLLMGVWVKCDDSTPLGAAAALCHLSPGRTRLIDPPDEVRDVLIFPESGLSLEAPEVRDV